MAPASPKAGQDRVPLHCDLTVSQRPLPPEGLRLEALYKVGRELGGTRVESVWFYCVYNLGSRIGLCLTLRAFKVASHLYEAVVATDLLLYFATFGEK